jgi:predicted DNA-binding transcriptional regulator AlpA
MSDSNGEFLVSLEEAGRLLGGISKKTVRRRIAEGVLPKPIKEGKFSRLFRSDVVAFIEKLKGKRDEKYGVRNSG